MKATRLCAGVGSAAATAAASSSDPTTPAQARGVLPARASSCTESWGRECTSGVPRLGRPNRFHACLRRYGWHRWFPLKGSRASQSLCPEGGQGLDALAKDPTDAPPTPAGTSVALRASPWSGYIDWVLYISS
jgi:hypothetical protein